MTERTPRDSVALLLAAVIGAFVLLSLIVVFVLALNGVAIGDTWTSLFGLVVAIVSALGGWLAGQSSARRNGNGNGHATTDHR